ncbi:MAG TPA: glutamine--fructose-6-phosphate transaminase (isomerizing) [Anaerolineales bacterium]|nr:glutamine--fructose-6-phosphate transaminase (isomerizing) [Anaerolineales bacterium]
MCGIVGYVGNRLATPIVLNGLKRLEYRGYDSAGIATIHAGKIDLRRDVGKLRNLQNLVESQPLSGTIGVGHTRWATHGEPSTRNAHPHLGGTGEVVVVQNGIVENYLELKEELIAEGIGFRSDTDTEVIVHLIERFYVADVSLEQAVRQALKLLRGSNAVVALSSREPGKLVTARLGNAGGVAIGIGQEEMFLASDMPAILDHTRRMVFLESGWLAVLTAQGYTLQTLSGQAVRAQEHQIAWDPVSAEKGEYKHFMQKEIHEQVRSLTDTIGGRLDQESGAVMLPSLNLTAEIAQNIDRIIITGCGTAAHAGMVGKILIENMARIPVEVAIASEFRYAEPIVTPNTVVIAISQSGETADTLAAMDEAKKRGARLWSVVNVIGSAAMRIADGYIAMLSGPEIGVASTKAFTAPLADLYLLAMLLGQLRGTLTAEQSRYFAIELAQVPFKVGQILEREKSVEQVAKALKEISHCLYLGRGVNMPIAYEGALKLKEISYIHAEGYPAGEMKHGPIALVDRQMPVIAIVPQDLWYEKMLSQLEQAKARGGAVVAVVTDGDERVPQIADYALWIPACAWQVSPILASIPLQLLSYHVAVLRGCDVDQPRNLAKSVTVE